MQAEFSENSYTSEQHLADLAILKRVWSEFNIYWRFVRIPYSLVDPSNPKGLGVEVEAINRLYSAGIRGDVQLDKNESEMIETLVAKPGMKGELIRMMVNGLKIDP